MRDAPRCGDQESEISLTSPGNEVTQLYKASAKLFFSPLATLIIKVPTQAYPGQPRPTPANPGQFMSIQVNSVQLRPTQDNLGQLLTQANSGQHGPAWSAWASMVSTGQLSLYRMPAMEQ